MIDTKCLDIPQMLAESEGDTDNCANYLFDQLVLIVRDALNNEQEITHRVTPDIQQFLKQHPPHFTAGRLSELEAGYVEPFGSDYCFDYNLDSGVIVLKQQHKN